MRFAVASATADNKINPDIDLSVTGWNVQALKAAEHGRIMVGGQDVTGVPVNKREMAMVFLQGFLNWTFPARVLGISLVCGCAGIVYMTGGLDS